jgi:uncharacterized protein
MIYRTLYLIYRSAFSARTGRNCRFEPTCSEYALAVFQRFSFGKAFYLTIKRIYACKPSIFRANDSWKSAAGVVDPSKPKKLI